MKKILILAANPQGTVPLQLDKEIREIEIGLERAKKRDSFKLVKKQAVQVKDLRRAILDEQPQIVHFSGHGEGNNGLAFEDELRDIKLVDGEALAGLFQLFAGTVECVVLNGCFSEVQAKAIVRYIDFVIGMTQAIDDGAAIEFAIAFYDALGAGQNYAFAYNYAVNAIHLERSATVQRGLTPIDATDHGSKQKQDHLIPVLLKRENATQQTRFRNTMLDEQQRESTTEPTNCPEEALNSEKEFLFDVYISYVDKDPDSSWVWEVLLPKLEGADLRAAVSGDSERPGVARVINVEQGLRQAKRTVIVLSDNYLSDHMAEFENTLGQTMGIQEGTYRLLPIKAMPLDTSRLPTRLSMLTALDLTHPRRADREFDRLIEALRQPLPRM